MFTIEPKLGKKKKKRQEKKKKERIFWNVLDTEPQPPYCPLGVSLFVCLSQVLQSSPLSGQGHFVFFRSWTGFATIYWCSGVIEKKTNARCSDPVLGSRPCAWHSICMTSSSACTKAITEQSRLEAKNWASKDGKPEHITQLF
jgi:hypothetical protein